MLGQLSSPAYLEIPLTVRRTRGVHAAYPALTPRKNRLLEALPVEHYERLVPYLEPVPLHVGATIYAAGDREKYLYFIVDGIVSRVHMTESGASAEAAVTGREGVIGIAAFLGGESTQTNARVVTAGYAYRLPRNVLKSEMATGGPLLHILLRYTQTLIAQCGQMAACNLHHSIEQRLCRWILASLYRLSSSEMTITHAQLSDLLGVRREGVSEAYGRLQEMGLINHRRSHVEVVRHRQLELLACECYVIEKRELERSLNADAARAHNMHVSPHVMPLVRRGNRDSVMVN